MDVVHLNRLFRVLVVFFGMYSGLVKATPETSQEEIEQLIARHGHLLTENSKDVVTLYSLAWAYKQKNWFAQSIAALEQIIRVAPLDGPAHHALGMVLRMSNDSDRAIQILEKAASIQPNDLDLLFDLGVLYLQEKHPKQAAIHFQKAVELAPDFLAASYNYGLALLLDGRVQDAMAMFDHVCQLDKNFAQGWQNLGITASIIQERNRALHAFSQMRQQSMANAFNIGVMQHRLGDVRQAEDAYQQVLASVHDFTPAMYNLGVLIMEKKDTVRSVQLFRDTLRVDPDFFHAGFQLSEMYLRQGLLNASLDLLRQLKPPPLYELYPHLWLGEVYWFRGMKNQYLEQMQKVKQANVQSVELLRKKGEQAYQKEEWLVAMQIWSELHRLLPDNIDILLVYGKVALQVNQLAIALDCFTRVVRQERSVEGQIGLAQTYQQLGKSKRALKEMERTAVIAPEVPLVWAILGQMQFENGYKEEASLSFGRALRLDRKYPIAYIGLARLAVQENQLGEAIDLLKQAASLKSNDAQLYDELGLLLFRQGHVTDSIDYYEKALVLSPKSPLILFHIATAKLSLGQKNQAYLLLKQASELAPENQDIQYLYAFVCSQIGKWVEALLQLEQVLTENPQHEEAIRNREKLWKIHGTSIQPELLQIP